MFGFYDYTVWLTYASLVSAVMGIGVSLHGIGHPYWGIFFLMISGLCDAFDGRVARTKKNRTETEKKFGIQIDSLADLVAFGVLPICIGDALVGIGPDITGVCRVEIGNPILRAILMAIGILTLIYYVLMAMIRLAYFNVCEEERQSEEGGCRREYIGLPVTSAALIFPTILLLQYVLPFDISLLYYLGLVVTGTLFVSKIKVKKPGLKGILMMIAFGAVVGILLLVGMFAVHHIH